MTVTASPFTPPPLPFARVARHPRPHVGASVFAGTCRAPGEEVAVLVRIETAAAPTCFDLRLHYPAPTYDPDLGPIDVHLRDQSWEDVRVWLARYRLRDGWWPAAPPSTPPPAHAGCGHDRRPRAERPPRTFPKTELWHAPPLA